MAAFKIHYDVDQNSGRMLYGATIDGVECVSIPVQGKRARKLIALRLISSDLTDALQWIQKCHEIEGTLPTQGDGTRSYTFKTPDEPHDRTAKALLYASLIMYGKCFSDAQDKEKTGKGRLTTLERNDYVAPEFRDKHDEVIGFRNTIVAHAVNPLDNGELVVFLHPADPNVTYTEPLLQGLTYWSDREESPSFEDLIAHVQANVEAKTRKLAGKLTAPDGEVPATVAEYRAGPK